MHRIKNKFFIFYIVILMIMIGCDGSSQKMCRDINKIEITAEPSILEVHNGKVYFKLNIEFPPKYFGKKSKVEILPILKYEGGENELTSICFQGERVEGNSPVIKYYYGGKKVYESEFDYKEDMKTSYLELRIQVISKDSKISIEYSRRIAKGMIVIDKKEPKKTFKY